MDVQKDLSLFVYPLRFAGDIRVLSRRMGLYPGLYQIRAGRKDRIRVFRKFSVRVPQRRVFRERGQYARIFGDGPAKGVDPLLYPGGIHVYPAHAKTRLRRAGAHRSARDFAGRGAHLYMDERHLRFQRTDQYVFAEPGLFSV